MRFLGIDYGTKRIGLAVSDERATLAFPKEILENNNRAIDRIKEIIENEGINGIVVGESVNFAGAQNPLSKEIETFIRELENKVNMSIERQKEFLTSVEARGSKNSKQDFHKGEAHSKIKEVRQNKVDSGAAALILQRYLDRLNKK